MLGCSSSVGVPTALMFMQRGATVTMTHAATRNIESVVRRADIVVAAMGKPQIVKGTWIKTGAVVLDVGIDFIDDPSDERGQCYFHKA